MSGDGSGVKFNAFNEAITVLSKNKSANNIDGALKDILASIDTLAGAIPMLGKKWEHSEIKKGLKDIYKPENINVVSGILSFLKIDTLLNNIIQQSNPIKQLYKFFTNGKWLNTYQVPYFPGSNDILYLKSANASKWDLDAGLKKIVGEKFSTAIQKNSDIQYPVTPIFNARDNSQNVFDSVTTTFYLINDNEENLVKNFKFLHSLFAGTQWILLKFGYRRAPNVYNVYCNSRFNYIWASIDMTVHSCGKVFRAPQQRRHF